MIGLLRRIRDVLTGRRGWFFAGGAVALLLLAVAVLVAVRLVSVRDDLREAQRRVDLASVALEDGDLAGARSHLDQARQLLISSNSALYSSFEMQVAGAVPVASENLDAMRESIGLALRGVNGAGRVLAAAEPLQGADGRLEVPLSDGALPLDAVADVQRELEALSRELPPRKAPAAGRFVVPPVREARSDLYASMGRHRARVDVLARGLHLAADMAGAKGPRRYLIAVANTAEMRGSGGMILNYGVLEGRDGGFELARFGRIDELAVDRPLPAHLLGLPDDYRARWAGFEVDRLWRNATMASDLRITAPVLEGLFQAATGDRVDGVIQIDPHGLAAILEGIGPVEVAEVGRVSAGNVVALTLNEAYFRYPDIEQRSDVLGDVAEAVFRKLVDGDYDSLRPLAEALVRAVDGRHVLMHARAADVESEVRYFRADGSLPPVEGADALHLTVQNVAANKLDYYLDTSLTVTGSRSRDTAGTVRAVVRVANRAPPGQSSPRYVFGPFDDSQEAGLYRGIVSLYLPLGTSLVQAGGGPVASRPAVLTEGGRPVVSFSLDIPAGGSAEVVLDLRMAPTGNRPYQLIVVPSPRVRPTTVVIDGLEVPGGTIDTRLKADRTWVLTPE